MRSFAEIVNSSETKKTQNPAVLGTVSIVDGEITVIIDGSTIATPATTLVDVETGDRVDVVIQDHKAIITGNHSSPAITRHKKVYTTMTDEGVVVGMLDDEDEPTGTYLLINATTGAFQVIDSNGNSLATFGEQVVIGPGGETLHTITNSSGFNIIKNGKVVATFGTSAQIGAADTIHAMIEQNGFVLRDGSGNVLASFGATANIGKTDGIHVAINSSGMSILSSTGEVLASFGSEIKIKRIETDALLVEKNDAEARAVVRAYSGTTVAAEGRLAATATTGRFGLYDDKHSKWLINSESDGNVSVSLTPSKISSTEYTATAVSTTTYVNAPIANMSTWSVIVAYVAVGNDYVSCTFIKGGPSYQNVSSHNGTTVIRASVTADWANNRLRLRCLAATGTLYTSVKLRDVYGITKA